MSTRTETPTGTDRASILVVDDSNLMRGILKEELEAEGYRVYQADDGDRGLELARDVRPDVVLLDVMLPGTDGYEICRRIKGDEATSDIPVILVSGKNELKDKLAGFEAGAEEYLTKPFFTKELLARLRTKLRVKENLASSRRLGQFYLEMLVGIGSAITSPFKVDDEVEIILRQALRAVQASRGSILLLNGEDGTLEVRGSIGYNGRKGPKVGQRFRISEKLPMLNTAESGGTMGIGLYHDPEHDSVFIPMVAKERLVGGIELEQDGRAKRLGASDQRILYALASQGAIFLENARLERDVRSMFLNIIVSMAGAVDAKDAYTHGHSLRVARVALIVGLERGLSREQLEPLLLSGILHDVGKIAIPDSILKKPDRLNREEFEIMKQHPVIGARMLSHIPALGAVIPGIRHHHEYWDGSGYPDGLEGEEIPLGGRIILIADAIDAMTTDRVYRKGMTMGKALKELKKFAGIQFDAALVAHLREAYDQGKFGDDLSKSTPTLHELIDRIR